MGNQRGNGGERRKQTAASTPSRKWLRNWTIVATTIIAVLLSPFVLVGVSYVGNLKWLKLSYIGQTYGAASALLAALGIVAISASLIIQRRQVEIAQVQAARSMQLELTRLSLQYPNLPKLWINGSSLNDEYTESVFLNLVFKYYEMGFISGFYSEEGVGAILHRRFLLEETRRWWSTAVTAYSSEADNKVRRRFVEIANFQYELAGRALAPVDGNRASDSVDARSAPDVQTSSVNARRLALAAAVGVGASAVAYLRWRRRPGPRPPRPTI